MKSMYMYNVSLLGANIKNLPYHRLQLPSVYSVNIKNNLFIQLKNLALLKLQNFFYLPKNGRKSWRSLIMQSQDSSQPCVICKEDFGLPQVKDYF